MENAKIGLIFGTDTGNTEEIGEQISDVFAGQGYAIEMLNVANASVEDFEQFDMLIMGIPTWDFGGIQEEWENFEDDILACDLNNKTVAIYGLGDQLGYGDYFLDAIGWLNERVLKAGARVIGSWPTTGYDFEASLGVNADKTLFCGLAIDEDQQEELTAGRISTWVSQVLQEY